METLIVAHHRNHHRYYDRHHGHGGRAKSGSIGSAISGDFRDINCRTFQSDTGLLPTSLKSKASPFITKKAFSASPETPCPSFDESSKSLIRTMKSSTTPIPVKVKIEKEREFNFSELWAGPAYSNSPPPSSLPMPKFSLQPKRTVSLELPFSPSGIDFQPISKSAPASPTRKRSPSPSNMFDNADSATKTLRRILNLDLDDE